MKLLRLAYNYNPHRRKMRTYIPEFYEAIPHFYKPVFRDIHDGYKLRTKEQINKQIENKEYVIDIKFTKFPDDIRGEIMERKVWLIFNILQFKFTPMQMERFKTIMGPRYQDKKYVQQITVEMYKTLEENLTKAQEMFYEVIIQSKRAP